MKTRVITAVVAIGAFIPLLFVLPSIFLQIILGLFCAVGVYELLGETGIIDKKSLFLYFSCIVALAIPFIASDANYNSKHLYIVVWLYMFVAFLFGVLKK